jgi:hypothetical protein
LCFSFSNFVSCTLPSTILLFKIQKHSLTAFYNNSILISRAMYCHSVHNLFSSSLLFKNM